MTVRRAGAVVNDRRHNTFGVSHLTH
ncbi:hypothetical protein BN11_2610004 [Nostocoides australiense Ben110]|uniref:Uncharacterized protein n=1 Tax=Nostocoides australiense Ben110 TaxID=1193182 RepID=W6JXI0_9MICO|nr:hypothetical protein BN11_2610004 [Tetrasphaera australiensis Ben110]